MNERLKKELESTFKDILVADSGDNCATVTIKYSQALAVLRFLKDKGFDHLALLSAVDWIEDNCFELCFILTSYVQNDDEYMDSQKLHIILKTRIPREKPQFKTVIGIFPNAEPYEREIHELFGINFEGHPRLTPLFLEREYKIPPFRKDFDTRKYAEEVFDQIPFAEDKDKRGGIMDKFLPQNVEQALSKAMHPEINYSLIDLGMIKDVVCEEKKVGLTLKLPFPQVPVKDLLIESIKRTLSDLDNSIQVEIDMEQMSQEERENFKKMAKEGWKL